MVYGRHTFVWVAVALAALVGQIVPQARCNACERPCCTSETAGRPIDAGATATCPLCTATDACQSPLEGPESPCQCQLDARQSLPLAASRTVAAAHDVVAWPAGVAVPSIPPRSSGVSADYLSASLAVPIRPARILYGVWRN